MCAQGCTALHSLISVHLRHNVCSASVRNLLTTKNLEQPHTQERQISSGVVLFFTVRILVPATGDILDTDAHNFDMKTGKVRVKEQYTYRSRTYNEDKKDRRLVDYND